MKIMRLTKNAVLKVFSRLKYRQKIMLMILVFTIGPLALIGPFYLEKTLNGKINEIIDKNRSELDSGVQSINDLLNENAKKIAYIINNRRLNDILTVSSEDSVSDVFEKYQIINDVFGALESNNIRRSIVIYTFNDLVYEGDYIRKIAKLDPETANEIRNAKENTFIWKFRTLTVNSMEEEYICLYKLVTSLDQPLAVTEIRIPFRLVTASLQFKLPENSFMAYATENSAYKIVSDNSEIIPQEMDKLVENYLRNGQSGPFYTIDRKIKANSAKVILFISKKQVYSQLLNFIFTAAGAVILLVLLLILLAEVVSFTMTKRLTGIIYKIDADVEKLVQSDELPLNNSSPEDEFGKIDAKFNQLIHRIKEYYRLTSAYEVERKNLELDLLQACINPHFLYNTLSAIKWIYPDEKLEQVIDSMVKFYRITLNKGNNILKVWQEIEMLKEYVRIQKFAYKFEYQCVFDVEEGIMEYPILKNLLQPIVENALLHGIHRMKARGLIKIAARLEEEKIIFEVIDNGVGMKEDVLKQVLAGENLNLYSGYGMNNVQKRIQSYYGGEFGISIKSRVNEGTTVTVVIPAGKRT